MRTAPFAVLALSLAACSGLGPAGPDAPETPLDPGADYPAYETFDPAAYPAEAPAVAATVIHDVPADVMAGRVNVPGNAPPPQAPREPQPTQVEGFRVQVFSSASRESAEVVRDEAVAWWEGVQNEPGAPGQLEATVAYLQPYYRVRLGAFAARQDAEAALALVRRRYPEAFLVPDTVTVMR